MDLNWKRNFVFKSYSIDLSETPVNFSLWKSGIIRIVPDDGNEEIMQLIPQNKLQPKFLNKFSSNEKEIQRDVMNFWDWC